MTQDQSKIDNEPKRQAAAASTTPPGSSTATGFRPGDRVEVSVEQNNGPRERVDRRTTIAEVISVLNLPQAQAPGSFDKASDVMMAFFLEIFEAARLQSEVIDGFEEFTLHEKMHLFLESLLAELSPNRPFISQLSLRFGVAGVFDRGLIKKLRKEFVETIADFFRDAIQKGEIPAIDIDGPAVASLSNYTTTVVGFWLRDFSPQHRVTTEFIDQSLHVVLPATISSARLGDLGTFVRRQVQGFWNQRFGKGRSDSEPINRTP